MQRTTRSLETSCPMTGGSQVRQASQAGPQAGAPRGLSTMPGVLVGRSQATEGQVCGPHSGLRAGLTRACAGLWAPCPTASLRAGTAQGLPAGFCKKQQNQSHVGMIFKKKPSARQTHSPRASLDPPSERWGSWPSKGKGPPQKPSSTWGSFFTLREGLRLLGEPRLTSHHGH